MAQLCLHSLCLHSIRSHSCLSSKGSQTDGLSGRQTSYLFVSFKMVKNVLYK